MAACACQPLRRRVRLNSCLLSVPPFTSEKQYTIRTQRHPVRQIWRLLLSVVIGYNEV